MKIAIIGANGKVGQLLEKEAVYRGHDVTAIVRKKNQSFNKQTHILIKDLFNLTYDDLKDFDVIIDAFGTWSPESLSLHQTSLKYLSDLLSNKPNRLLVVGGAGSLFVDNKRTLRLVDSDGFPAEYKPLASNQAESLYALKKRTDVKWTYLSPAPEFIVEGDRTGSYLVGIDQLLTNSNGTSQISYSDYAIAMIDEAESAKHIQKHFSVIAK